MSAEDRLRAELLHNHCVISQRMRSRMFILELLNYPRVTLREFARVTPKHKIYEALQIAVESNASFDSQEITARADEVIDDAIKSVNAYNGPKDMSTREEAATVTVYSCPLGAANIIVLFMLAGKIQDAEGILWNMPHNSYDENEEDNQ
jgi:hypothetical protein